MKLKKMVLLAAAFSLLFSGCSKEVKIVTPKVPKLKKCIVKAKKISFSKSGNRVCMDMKSFKLLKRQNYRVRVCNKLLNRQIEDFNTKFTKDN